jgi:hypothetical protein
MAPILVELYHKMWIVEPLQYVLVFLDTGKFSFSKYFCVIVIQEWKMKVENTPESHN